MECKAIRKRVQGNKNKSRIIPSEAKAVTLSEEGMDGLVWGG